ncbi:MAG: hypothetical protein WBG08_04535 [Litorimonas sp.]
MFSAPADPQTGSKTGTLEREPVAVPAALSPTTALSKDASLDGPVVSLQPVRAKRAKAAKTPTAVGRPHDRLTAALRELEALKRENGIATVDPAG